jgi:hypothetical protein
LKVVKWISELLSVMTRKNPPCWRANPHNLKKLWVPLMKRHNRSNALTLLTPFLLLLLRL